MENATVHENFQNRFMFDKMVEATEILKENSNYKEVSTLLDTSLWKNFTNEYSDYAIGSPTLEMWIASWNLKGYITLTANMEENGYSMEKTTTTNQKGYEASISNDEGYNDTLYFPHTNYINNNDENSYMIEGYYLASPSQWASYEVTHITVDGTVNGFKDAYNYLGIRPVVCLKSSVQLTQNSEGVWQIS